MNDATRQLMSEAIKTAYQRGYEAGLSHGLEIKQELETIRHGEDAKFKNPPEYGACGGE